MTFQQAVEKIEREIPHYVWWSPEQIARGENIVNDPKKGERAWAVPRTTAELLHDLILKNNLRKVLELGTSIGYSTVWIADALRQTNGNIDSIERSENKIPVAMENIKSCGFEDLVSIHHGEIIEVLKAFSAEQRKFDFVFMDADRGHYHEYFPIIESMLRENAIIVADNAGNMNARMQPFLKLLADKKWEMEIVDMDNGILLAKKPA